MSIVTATSGDTDYVQGTKVKLDVAITDPDTGYPADPPSLTCRIQDPVGHTTDQTLTTGVTRLGPGQYRAIMDTSAAAGVWPYEWIVDDGTESIVQDQVNVIPAVPAPSLGTTTILDLEKISGDYLRGDPDVVALDARVAGQLPKTFTKPWIRVTQIDATNATDNLRVEHLVSYLLQYDAYSGAETDNAQAQASALGRTVRAALIDMQDRVLEGAIITGVEVRNDARLPDLDFDPPRERRVLTVEIWAHPAVA